MDSMLLPIPTEALENVNDVVQRGCSRGGSGNDEEGQIDTIDRIICGYVRQGGDDLTMRQVAILVQITQNPLEMTPLAEKLGLSLPSVSRSMDMLERLKLARRIRKGRNVTAAATPLGSARIGRLMLVTSVG